MHFALPQDTPRVKSKQRGLKPQRAGGSPNIDQLATAVKRRAADKIVGVADMYLAKPTLITLGNGHESFFASGPPCPRACPTS